MAVGLKWGFFPWKKWVTNDDAVIHALGNFVKPTSG
jgi:hypothetical protein